MKFEKKCVVSLNAYHRLSPKSFFGRRLDEKEIKDAKKSLVFLGFCKLAHLAKDKRDFYIILKLIDDNIEGVCCMLMAGGDAKEFSAKFLETKRTADKNTLDRFEKYFREEESKVL